MSTVLKGFKIRAYPNATQRALVARTLGTKRWLWNTALELRSAAYKELGLRLTSTDIRRAKESDRGAARAMSPR